MSWEGGSRLFTKLFESVVGIPPHKVGIINHRTFANEKLTTFEKNDDDAFTFDLFKSQRNTLIHNFRFYIEFVNYLASLPSYPYSIFN